MPTTCQVNGWCAWKTLTHHANNPAPLTRYCGVWKITAYIGTDQLFIKASDWARTKKFCTIYAGKIWSIPAIARARIYTRWVAFTMVAAERVKLILANPMRCV